MSIEPVFFDEEMKLIRKTYSILRTINILRIGYVPLEEVLFVRPSIDKHEFIHSVIILFLFGYIELRDIESKQVINTITVLNDELEAKVTKKGINMISGTGHSGFIDDVCNYYKGLKA